MKFSRNFTKWALLAFLFFSLDNVIAQNSIEVSSACVTGTISLSQISNVNGKPAFQGTGTVAGNSGVVVAIAWSEDDNAWLLMFDGQPYFVYLGNPASPPNNIPGNWKQVDGTENDCNATNKVNISGSGTQNDPLPVTLVSFKGSLVEKSVLLEWSTTEELENLGFEINHSVDLKSWNIIGFVDGSGTTNVRKKYTFMDNSPSSSQNYYQLRQTDFSGKATLSRIISVSNVKKSIAIYPNPVTGEMLFLTDTSNGWEKGEIFDMSGRYVGSIQPGKSNVSSLNSGNYLLRLVLSNGQQQVLSFLKAR